MRGLFTKVMSIRRQGRGEPGARACHAALVPLLVLLLPLAGAAQETAQTAEQRYFDWARPPFSTDEYRARLGAVLPALRAAGGGVLLIPGATGGTRGYTFRQTDDMMYFTGLEVPLSVLAIDADSGMSLLYVPRRNARFENPSRRNDFPGRPLADDTALAPAGYVSRMVPATELDAAIARWVAAGRQIWVNAGQSGPVATVPLEPVAEWDANKNLIHYLQQKHPSARFLNGFDAIAGVRMIKTPVEITALREAAQLTERAITHGARAVRVGVDERTLEAEFEAACKRGGAQRLPFASIIKSGPNSLWPWRILAAHYDRRNRRLDDGDLVIFDVGCELNGYVSDVGRTFPANGRFTAAQRAALEVSTRVSDAIIAAVRPGITLLELQNLANGIIPERNRKYMQTGLFFGHHLGLSSGDPFLPDAKLAPGMVFTVEPWYYDHDNDIAVFIEDVVLVTEGGAELLTAVLPRSAAALERLMSSGSR